MLVLAQAQQQLAEALLARAGRAAARALAAEVDEARHALPARGAAGSGGRVVARSQKGVGLAARLRDALLLLGVVVLVEVVDGSLRGLDRLGLAARRQLVARADGGVTPLAPFPARKKNKIKKSTGVKKF
jgi:hypothetical protein